MYCIWNLSLCNDDSPNCNSIIGLSTEQECKISLGEKLSSIPSLIEAEIDSADDTYTMDCIGTSLGVPIVSQKVAKLLPQNSIQLVPIQLNKKVGEPYYLVNSIDVRQNINLGKSEYETFIDFPEEIRRIKRMVLNPIVYNKPLLYRLKEIPGCLLVLLDSLKQELQKNSTTCGEFTTIDTYQLGYLNF